MEKKEKEREKERPQLVLIQEKEYRDLFTGLPKVINE